MNIEPIHPTLDHLVEHPSDPAVQEHLSQCPACRVQSRLLVKVLEVDPGSLPGIVDARKRLNRAQHEASVSLSQSLEGGDFGDDLVPGTVVDDRYVVEAAIGRGGMGAVYRARHLELGSVHALKVLHWASPSIRERLIREGRAQGGLRHPHIVPVTDVVSVEGAPGLVLDFVDGPSLADWLAREGKPPLAVADRLAVGVIKGVAAAHAAGFVHRDLKPANVLLAPGDDGPVPKVADFGLVKVIADGKAEARLTKAETPMGTPAYMAPEQIRDASTADERSDVFSLGALLFELVTGRRAFDGSDWLDTCDRIRAGRHEPLDADLPPRIARTIERCLEVDPADRLPDCPAVLAAWTSEGPPLRATPRRAAAGGNGRWVVGGILLLVLGMSGVGLGAFAVVMSQQRDEEVSHDPALKLRYETAWSSFLLGDFAAARGQLDRFGPEDLLARLLLAASLDFDGHFARATTVLAESLPYATGDDRAATLLRLYASTIWPQARLDAWDAWLAEHPDDFMGHLIAAHLSGESEAYDAAKALQRPGTRVVERVRVHDAVHGARRDASVDGVRRRGSFYDGALEAGADSRAYTKPPETRWDEIIMVFGVVLETTPDDARVRAELADLLGLKGDRAGREAHLAVLFGPETERGERLRWAVPEAWFEFGLGRWHAAQGLLEQCESDGASDGATGPMLPEAVLCADARLDMALLLGDAAVARSARTALASWVTRPEVPPEMSRRFGAGLVVADARIALLDGDATGAEALREQIVDAGPSWVRWSTGEEAALDLNWRIRASEPWIARAYHQERRAQGCVWELGYGRAALAEGNADEGLRALREVASGATCPEGPFQHWYLRAEARVALAEALMATGDTDAARAAIDGFHAAWPEVDPDHPLALRAARLP